MFGVSRGVCLLMLLAGGGSVPCIPDGSNRIIDFPIPVPEIDGGDLGGIGDRIERIVPVDWEYSKVDPPEAFDADRLSEDDPLGSGALLPGGRVGVSVENHGGKLSGPNGKVENGGLGEGKCLEVYMKVVVKVKVTLHAEASIKPGGIGGSGGGGLDVWVYLTLRTDKKKVCPC